MNTPRRKFVKKVKSLVEANGRSINRIETPAASTEASEILAKKTSPILKTVGKLAEAVEVSVRDLFPEDAPR